MDKAHEQIADSGAIQRLIEECVFSIQDGFLQCALDDVMPTPGLCRVGRFLPIPAAFAMLTDAA